MIVLVVEKKLLRAVINSVPDQLNHNLLSHTKIFCAALGFKFVGGDWTVHSHREGQSTLDQKSCPDGITGIQLFL